MINPDQFYPVCTLQTSGVRSEIEHPESSHAEDGLPTEVAHRSEKQLNLFY
jgi:hypothetical protein